MHSSIRIKVFAISHDLVFGSLLLASALPALLPLVDEFADLLPFSVEFLLLVLSSFDASRLSSVSHFHAELESRFGQSLPAAHVVSVLLLRVEIPPANRTLFVALK